MKKFDAILFILLVLYLIAKYTLSDFIQIKYISATFIVLTVTLFIGYKIKNTKKEKN